MLVAIYQLTFEIIHDDMWENLKSAIAKVIKTNGNQEITGQLLQNELLRIVDEVGRNAAFAGIATPTIDPGTPDGPVFYFTAIQGTYPSFDNVKIDSLLAIIYNTENGWVSKSLIDFSIDLFIFVKTLPVVGEENKIYFVPAEKPEEGNLFDEFIWNNNTWERLGSAKVDLSEYAKKAEVEASLQTKQDALIAGENITIIDNVISSTGGGGGSIYPPDMNGDFNDDFAN